MAMNAWSLLSPQDQNLASLGSQGLNAGTIDPDMAMAHASSYLGLDPSSLSSTPSAPGPMPGMSGKPMLPGGFSPLLDMNANPMANVNPKLAGAKKSSSQTATSDATQKMIKNSYLNPDEYNALRNTIMSTPEMKQQQEGADQMSSMLDMNAKLLGKQASQVNLAPLMALADSQTGSNLSQGYTAPESAQNMMSKLQDFATKVQAKKEDIAKQIMTGAKDLKSGSVQDQYMQKMVDAQNAGFGGAGAASGLSNVRKAALIQSTGSAFDKDKILTQVAGTTNSLDRATSMLQGNTPITAKNFALLQQDMINAMAPGGAATEGKVQREMVENIQSKINELNLKFGDVQDLRKDPGAKPTLDQLQGLINQVRVDYGKAAVQRASELEQNSMGNPIPEVQQAATAKADMLRKKYAPPVSDTNASHPGDAAALAWAKLPENKTNLTALRILKANGVN